MLRNVRLLLALSPALFAAPAAAQVVAAPATVPYVPTPMPVVSAMLELGRVGSGDVVYDLGSGDGRIVITAAQRHGVRGVGFEIDPRLIRRSREAAAAAGVDSLVRFVAEDLFSAELGEATVVMLYLSPYSNLELRPRLLDQLAPGSRVVSNTFHMNEWEADSVVHVGEGATRTAVYLWTVPARVDGFWQLALEGPGGEQRRVLELFQRFQRLEGAARADGREWPLAEGRLAGREIAFELHDGSGDDGTILRFTGRLDDGVLRGTYTSSRDPRPRRWRAARFTR